MNTADNIDLFGNPVTDKKVKVEGEKRKKVLTDKDSLPEKLGKAIRLPVPDFNDPNRKPTCLEIDFPIAQINALSNLEGNAGKPIYQMSKWWARRRSSVFRSMLIAAGTEAPKDPSEAAKKVWDHYYCNHQKAGSFKNLRVLDCFMGGGTTLVEGSRLGMQMTGVDLNPVARLVVKNELACSDPIQIKTLFDHIHEEVKPQIQPFYTSNCPRGHNGKWIAITTGEEVEIDPIGLPPEERRRYRWYGPEVIYTFWAKHSPCQSNGCNHRTPFFRTPVIAEKKLCTNYIPLTCPHCGVYFHAELGETRMAPGVERVVLQEEPFDFVITDPPFGNNLYYADLADFFYVWLRIPLLKWYDGLPEHKYFEPERTPHSVEAIDNPAEHPDDRANHEKSPFIENKHLAKIIELTTDAALQVKDPNPLYRPVPSSEFYSQTLSACWAEAGRLLKPGGIMAFTFHHSEDQAWIDILKALFDAGYFLVSTYPIRSDEMKGDASQFGSKKIEYDIIHVCRKRLAEPEPVSWARMRRWVKEESKQLKELLEHTHGKDLPESDLRVILRGKSLEFYSRHYGKVLSGDGQVLAVRDALLGINQLLDDLLEDTSQTGGIRPPDIAEPSSRLYLRLFHAHSEMDRDELHKTLRGTGISQGDLEALGWIRVVGRSINVVPISERFEFFTAHGRNRKVIRTDLDQTHFLIGAAHPKSEMKIEAELNNPNFRIKKAVDEILKWYATTCLDLEIQLAARTASQIVEHWRNRRKEEKPEAIQLNAFEQLELEE